jgi:hypothetical protein
MLCARITRTTYNTSLTFLRGNHGIIRTSCSVGRRLTIGDGRAAKTYTFLLVEKVYLEHRGAACQRGEEGAEGKVRYAF